MECLGQNLELAHHGSGFVRNKNAADAGNLVLSGNASSDQHAITISSSEVFAPGITTNYTASQRIQFTPGFYGQAGTKFLGTISAVQSAPSYEWVYKMDDHLGNTRVLFTDKNNDGKIRQSSDQGLNEVLAFKNYSAFGLEVGGSHLNASMDAYRYTYNGKEELGFSGYQDYGARQYDASVGRFMGVDMLTSSFPQVSPYSAFNNNPLRFTDPTGMAAEDWIEKDGQMMYDNRVTNQADATALYGEGATYRPNGYIYTASNGANIELGDYGFFKSDGQIHSSPDLAQNSLANTNPIRAKTDAQSQIAGVRGNYRASVGIAGFITADAILPEPTDAAWPKWAVYAVAGVIASYYVAKMEGEIEGIMRRAGGPQGVQYSLRATATGPYTCYTCFSGTMNLSLGDVWKYGETINPATRYSESFKYGMGVQQFDEFFGNQVQIKVMEKTKIYGYFLQNGHLPPGNKIFR
ncbi:MAG: hypothetical protein KDC49_21660 [Saprospiraceae bacterium]|nr:hypothetical protein [Saprospiraceae bacterium]